MIEYCIQAEILYESAPYHNAVFIGKDEKQIPRYAFLRGIYDSGGRLFKMEQAGSEKAFGFCIPSKGDSYRVAVYEACIDALAHMTLENGNMTKYRLALGGISAPKKGSQKKPMESKSLWPWNSFWITIRRSGKLKFVLTMTLQADGPALI